jgi:hypothetical protein
MTLIKLRMALPDRLVISSIVQSTNRKVLSGLVLIILLDQFIQKFCRRFNFNQGNVLVVGN